MRVWTVTKYTWLFLIGYLMVTESKSVKVGQMVSLCPLPVKEKASKIFFKIFIN